MGCSNTKCLALFEEAADVSEKQEAAKRSGERPRKSCAEEKEKAALRANYETGNRKRQAEVKAKTGCGATFSDTGHLSPNQVEHHRKAQGDRVVCGDCSKRAITAKGVADAAKRLERELTCAAFSAGFPQQGHISSAQETEHLTTGVWVVCANSKDLGFTARKWQAYECTGTCGRKLPTSSVARGGPFRTFRQARRPEVQAVRMTPVRGTSGRRA